MSDYRGKKIIDYPDILCEWDYNKNTIKPEDIKPGMSTKKFWWKCEHSHSFLASVHSRIVRKTKCPYCTNRTLLKGFNDLETLFPEIKEYWDYDKNDFGPSDCLSLNSTKVAWFKCKLGHSWSARIQGFVKGRRCPVCSNKKVLIGYNDLATTHPNLIKEWDFSKNTLLSPQQVTYGSEKKVWWICSKGHSWSGAIYSRANGRGCPKCFAEVTSSLTEKAFVFYLSKAFPDLKQNVRLKEMNKKELDIYIPSLRLGIEYDGHFYHKNSKRDLEKDILCEKNSITLIRIRESGCALYYSPAYFIECPKNHGEILKLTDVVNELFDLINKVYNLSLGHILSVEDDIADINEAYYTQTKTNSVASKCPHLLDEWCYEKNGHLNPEMISAGSNSKVFWKCNKGHIWSASISSRARGNGCPYCNGKYVFKGFNDLESKFPNLIKEWDFAKNSNINPNNVYCYSNKEVWWKCLKGHSWKTKISTRTKLNTGCPVCNGLLPDKGINDLETLYPSLTKEWDYEKNGDLKPSDFLPGSERKVWWICPNGHSYKTQIAIRADMKCGCPVCSNKIVLQGYNDLATLHPELAKEWDFARNNGLLPSQVGGAGGSHLRVWWICEKGHEWQTTITHRISEHSGCPICSRQKRT